MIVNLKTVNEVMNNLGTGDIVVIVYSESTSYPDGILHVIHMIEEAMSRHRSQVRTQMVGFQAIKGLWHGWRVGMGLIGITSHFGDVPRGVRKDFVAKCIELGVNLAENTKRKCPPGSFQTGTQRA
jgi:hypothetical protein